MSTYLYFPGVQAASLFVILVLVSVSYIYELEA